MGSIRTAYDLYRTYQGARSMLRALGLAEPPARSAAGGAMRSIVLLGGGMVLGAGIALCFAPMSGRELRGMLGERATRAAQKIRRADPDDDSNGRSTWTGD